MFYGDGHDSENPQDFLKTVEISFNSIVGIDSKAKSARFRRYLRSDNDAEEWFDSLDTATTDDWDKVVSAFSQRWPRRQRVKPTKAEEQKKLRDTVLKSEDILSKVEKGGVSLYVFVAWMAEIERLAALCDSGGAYVAVVYEKMPKPLRREVSDTHTTWKDLGAAVRAVSVTRLREHIEEEQAKADFEERLQALDRQNRTTYQRHQSSMDSLTRAFNNTSLSSPTPIRPYTTPPTNPGVAPAVAARGQTQLYASFNPAPPAPISAHIPAHAAPRQAAPTVYRAAADRLVDLRRTALPHHPDTPDGNTAYQRQMVAYSTDTVPLPGHTKPGPTLYDRAHCPLKQARASSAEATHP